MAEKKDTTHVLIAHSLVVFQRPRSTVWQCRYRVDGKWQRESTKQYDLKTAKAIAHDLLVEANVRKKLKAAPITRTFKDIAKHAVLRMEKHIADGEAKAMWNAPAWRPAFGALLRGRESCGVAEELLVESCA